MANFTNLTRSATAAVGAIILSTVFVTAAVGPATTAANGYAAATSTASVQVQQA